MGIINTTDVIYATTVYYQTYPVKKKYFLYIIS